MQQEAEQEWEDDPRKMVRIKQNFDTYKEAIISIGYLQVETFPNPIFLRLNSGISGSRKARKETRSGRVRGSHFWQPLKNYQLTHFAPRQSLHLQTPPPFVIVIRGFPRWTYIWCLWCLWCCLVMLCSELLSSKTGPWVTECVCEGACVQPQRWQTEALHYGSAGPPMLSVCWVLAPTSLLQNKLVCHVNW